LDGCIVINVHEHVHDFRVVRAGGVQMIPVLAPLGMLPHTVSQGGFLWLQWNASQFFFPHASRPGSECHFANRSLIHKAQNTPRGVSALFAAKISAKASGGSSR